VRQPEFQERCFNPNAELPYGAEPEDVADAIKEFYTFYSELNEFLLESGFGRIESILRANNALSDFVGNVVTEAVADQSDALIHNQKPDGFPDLLPVNGDEYAEQDYEVHHGDDGIETKCSKSNGGWQAHNNEEAWFIVFRYERGDPDEVVEDMAPLQFTQVLAGNLDEDDWSHSGRSEESRRTITSSIIASGMHKLRSNPIYQDPDAITGRGEELVHYQQQQAGFDPVFAEENSEYVTEQTELGEV
jgi:hypothetical protein